MELWFLPTLRRQFPYTNMEDPDDNKRLGRRLQNRSWAGFVECETDVKFWVPKCQRTQKKSIVSLQRQWSVVSGSWMGGEYHAWIQMMQVENPIDSPLRPFFLSMLACGFPCAKKGSCNIRYYRKRHTLASKFPANSQPPEHVSIWFSQNQLHSSWYYQERWWIFQRPGFVVSFRGHQI